MKKKLLKIKVFFKKRKKIFKPIFYTLGGISSFVVIWLILIIISIGGFSNFVERAKFEYIVWEYKNSFYSNTYDFCNEGGISYSGYGGFQEFFFNESTQFIDYFKDEKVKFGSKVFLPFFKGDPKEQIQTALNLKNKFLFNFNHCLVTRSLLRAAHQNNKKAKEILISYSLSLQGAYLSGVGQYLFKRYENILDVNDLYNPALVYAYANTLVDKKRIKFLKQSAERNYLPAMHDLILSFYDKKDLNISDCQLILKYTKYLSEQKSLIDGANQIGALMGKVSSSGARIIYECSDKKTNFSKAIVLIKDFQNTYENPSRISIFSHIYPALIYFNGWGNVRQNHELSYELLESYNNSNDSYKNEIAVAYLSYMNFKGMGVSKNLNKGLELAIKLPEQIISNYFEPLSTLSCKGIKYDFKIPYVKNETDVEKKRRKSEYVKSIIPCLNNSSSDENIKSLEGYIETYLVNWFKNPELFKKLNFLGQPQ